MQYLYAKVSDYFIKCSANAFLFPCPECKQLCQTGNVHVSINYWDKWALHYMIVYSNIPAALSSQSLTKQSTTKEQTDNMVI